MEIINPHPSNNFSIILAALSVVINGIKKVKNANNKYFINSMNPGNTIGFKKKERNITPKKIKKGSNGFILDFGTGKGNLIKTVSSTRKTGTKFKTSVSIITIFIEGKATIKKRALPTNEKPIFSFVILLNCNNI